MVDKEVIRTFRKPLIWVSIISILIIVLMALNIQSLSKSLDSAYDRQSKIYEEYDYKCGEGLKRVCVDEDKYAIEIGADETYAICDTDRKERAICVDEDKSWRQCEIGEWATCLDKDKDWISCDVGKDAKCIKEDIAGTISDTGWINSCPIGESSTCIDWDSEHVVKY